MRKAYRKAVMGITRSGSRFLIVHSCKQWRGWEFPKGGKEGKETDITTLKREVLEETGLAVKKVAARVPLVVKWDWKPEETRRVMLMPRVPTREVVQYTGTQLTSFVVDVPHARVWLDPLEHDAYKWVSAQQAMRMLRWDATRRVFRAALKLINKTN